MAKKSKSPKKQENKNISNQVKEVKTISNETADQFKPDPNDPDLPKLKEAISHRLNNLFTSSRDVLQDILNRRPAWMPARRELVMLYMDSRNFNECEKFLLNETRRIPKDDWTWQSLAKLYSVTANIKGEIDAIKKLNEITFNELLARRLFELQRDSDDMQGALETVLTLRAHKDTLDLEIANAKLLNLLGKKEEALQMCETLLKKTPMPAGAIELWVSHHLNDTNDPEAIVTRFLPLIEAGSKDPEVFAAVSRAYHRMSKYKEAQKLLSQAVEMNPNNSHWWYDLSLIQRQEGFLEESQASLKKSLAIAPLNPTGLRVIGVEYKYEYGDELFKKLNYAHAHLDQFKDDKKVELYHALAKAYEDVGELDTAFKYYEVAGELQGKLTPYHSAGPAGLLKMTRDRVRPQTFADFKLPRCESDKPIFVLGMPRSGTTLAEQIIATHPEAYGAGELKLLHRVIDGVSINKRIIETKTQQSSMPTYIPGVDISNCRTMDFRERGELYVKAIESLARTGGRPDAKKIVDKMPGNYFWTGVIPFILPNAKVIHTARHPLDNCLSIYRIFFPDGMPWSYQLSNLGKVSRHYYEHMEYWENNMPPGMLMTVHYEIVVADFENQAKKIINHVGLPWDEACLRFYENDRHVKTASLSQVRKPIYNSSVGRWRKYEEYLKPLIKELGPIVKNYEEMIAAKLEELNK